MFNRLGTRLLLVFVSLAVIPVVLASGFVAQGSASTLEAEALVAQGQEAELAGAEIERFITEREQELRFLVEVRRITNLPPAEQSATLDRLWAYDDSFRELALLDANGQELVRVARDRAYAETELVSRRDRNEFFIPSTTAAIYFSPVRFDTSIREPVITLGLPIIDLRSGNVGYVLVAEVRFRPVWDLIAAQQTANPENNIYVTDSSGQLIAHANPSLVLQGRTFDLPTEDGITTGLEGDEVVLARQIIRFGDQELIVVAERPASIC